MVILPLLSMLFAAVLYAVSRTVGCGMERQQREPHHVVKA
jgi:hypothetical protein